MRQWMWTVLIAGGLGLSATACKEREKAVEVQSGRQGEERKPDQKTPLGGQDSAEQEFYGTITATGGNGFSARDDDGVERPFVVDPETQFVRDGQRVSRAQLHEGTQIRTTYDEKQGKWIAEQVEIYAGTPSQDRPSAPMK